MQESEIDAFLDYLRYEKRFSKHTISAYTIDLHQFFEFSNEFDLRSVRTWISSLIQNQQEPSSINRKISALRTFGRYLVEKKLIEKNPTAHIKALKTKSSLPKFVDSQSLQNSFEQAQSEQGKFVTLLLYYTGIRCSELVDLSWQNVDLERDIIKVKGKGSKIRVIPILPELKELLVKQNRSTGYLIQSSKGQKSYRMLIYRLVNRYLQTLSLQQKSPHILRHSFATHLLTSGADLQAIKDLLGHRSLSSTQQYTHLNFNSLKKVYSRSHPKM